jgi:hypothetical protein
MPSDDDSSFSSVPISFEEFKAGRRKQGFDSFWGKGELWLWLWLGLGSSGIGYSQVASRTICKGWGLGVGGWGLGAGGWGLGGGGWRLGGLWGAGWLGGYGGVFLSRSHFSKGVCTVPWRLATGRLHPG